MLAESFIFASKNHFFGESGLALAKFLLLDRCSYRSWASWKTALTESWTQKGQHEGKQNLIAAV